MCASNWLEECSLEDCQHYSISLHIWIEKLIFIHAFALGNNKTYSSIEPIHDLKFESTGFYCYFKNWIFLITTYHAFTIP